MSQRAGGFAPYGGSEQGHPYPADGVPRDDHGAQAGDQDEHGHGGHGWMMLICCIPMLLIAVGLMVTGAASPGILVPAILCTLMMALMMRAMPGGGRHH